MEILVSVQCFVLLSAFLYFYFKYLLKQTRKIGFKIYSLFGILPELIKNRHRFLDWSTEILTDCPTNTIAHRRYGRVYDVITANPLNVEHMLKTKFDNYPKGHQFTALFVDFFGRGLFNSDGDLWRVHRKTTTYTLNTKSFKNCVMRNVVTEINTRLVPVLERASESGEVLDLQDILERFGFDNACKFAFDVDLGCLGSKESGASDEFKRGYDRATKISTIRFMYPLPFLWKLKKFLNLGSERRLRESITRVHGFVDKIIRSRIIKDKLKHNGDDFLSQLIEYDENHSVEFLRDMTISFILATRDTTSSALTWFFWLISSRPEIQHNILNELESIRVRNNKTIGDSYTLDELRDMHFLQAAITETMRLYPPVPIEPRMCLNDDVFPDGTFVGKDSTVTYNAYAMGRMKSIWGENCSEFRPERWLDENGICRSESPYKYPIFNGGPRMCLGKDMAYIQMKSIAANVIERFEMIVRKKETPEQLLLLILRMKGGLPVTVRLRER